LLLETFYKRGVERRWFLQVSDFRDYLATDITNLSSAVVVVVSNPFCQHGHISFFFFHAVLYLFTFTLFLTIFTRYHFMVFFLLRLCLFVFLLSFMSFVLCFSPLFLVVLARGVGLIYSLIMLFA